MTGRSPGPRRGRAPAAGQMPGIPDDADGYEGISVLSLAGRIPPDDGQWLLVTSVDSQPGAGFLAHRLRPEELRARGGDVLIRLRPEARKRGLPDIHAEVLLVLGGYLILAGSFERQDRHWWPEQIRAAVVFVMGMVTELEENGADLGARHQVSLDDPAAAVVGVPLGITSGRAATSQPGG
ncbi:MAG: hypothetical protein ACRDRJ_23065 [Streptosporangiaceae bacterium]